MLGKITKPCFLFAGIISSGAVLADTVELTTSDWPPYTIDNPSDGRMGFDFEVVTAAFEAVGDKAVINFYPWARALKLVVDGRVDGVVTCAYNEDRTADIIYSDPISGDFKTIVTSVAYRGPAPATAGDLRNFKRVIGVIKYSSTEKMKEMNIRHQAVPSVETALKQVAFGRADAAYFSAVNAQYTGQNLGLNDRLTFHRVQDEGYADFHICFSRKRQGIENIVSRFNKGLIKIKEAGQYKRIHDRYR